MPKAVVIGCGDPRLDAQFRKVASIIRAQDAIPYRFPGPEGIFRDPERAEEMREELAGIRRLMQQERPQAIAIMSHTDCSFHPVPLETHRRDIQLAAMLLKDKLETALPVHALLAIRGESDEDWIFEDLGAY